MKKIDAIREREKAATKGPWRTKKYGPYPNWVNVYSQEKSPLVCQVIRGNSPIGLQSRPDYFTEEKIGDNNAVFIAHSRADIPWMLELLEEAKELMIEIDGDHGMFEDWLQKYNEAEK